MWFLAFSFFVCFVVFILVLLVEAPLRDREWQFLSSNLSSARVVLFDRIRITAYFDQLICRLVCLNL